jgi:hypothetical protein
MPTEVGVIRWLNYLRDYAPAVALLSIPLVALRVLAASYYRPDVALAILAESSFSNIAAVIILGAYPFALLLLFGLAGPRFIYALVDRRRIAVAYAALAVFLLVLNAYSVPLGRITTFLWCVVLVVMYFKTNKGDQPTSIGGRIKENKEIMAEIQQVESDLSRLADIRPDSLDLRSQIAALRERAEAARARIHRESVVFTVVVVAGLLAGYAVPANFLAVQRIETRFGQPLVGSVLNSSNEEFVVLTAISRTVVHIPRSLITSHTYCGAASTSLALSNYISPTGQPRCYS